MWHLKRLRWPFADGGGFASRTANCGMMGLLTFNWAHLVRRIGDLRDEKIDNSGKWLIAWICLLR
jgi:hypothetical protein